MNAEILLLLILLLASPAAAAAGCGEQCPDRDADGVVDDIDQCPDSEPGAPVTMTGCALDSDGDGIPDYRDNCPHSSGTPVDSWGCPNATEIDLPGIEFEVNSAKLLQPSHAILDDAVEILRRYDNLQAEIAGHTDSRGSAAHNRQLSRLRARAVRLYLVEAGIDADRIVARGYGESRPITDNDTEESRRKNRRVVLRILDGQLRDSES